MIQDPVLTLSCQGTPVSEGVGMGQGWMIDIFQGLPDSFNTSTDLLKEKTDFLNALQATRIELVHLGDVPEYPLLFDTHRLILESPSLSDEVLALIEKGHSAVWALKEIIDNYSIIFKKIDNAYLRERSSELADVGKRILAHLSKNPLSTISQKYPDSVILILPELSVSSLLAIPRECLKGIISTQGSFHSHVAILARALGVPAVLGVNETDINQFVLKPLKINGTTGEICISSKTKKSAVIASVMPSIMFPFDSCAPVLYLNSDGARIAQIKSDLALGAQGIGLYRTEIDFMKFSQFPTEQEQCLIYRTVLEQALDHPVNMRVLDIGGDKALPYFSCNGNRGMQVMLNHPILLLTQLRAMLEASRGLNNLQILLPMIMGGSQLEKAIDFIHQAYNQIEQGVQFPLIGAMIEVPSAVSQIEAITKQVDFISVGSNDLTHSLLGIDRASSKANHLYNGLQPVLLQALEEIVTAVHAQGKKVSICGEIAGDPVAFLALIGLGLDSLSMDGQHLRRVNKKLSQVKKY